VADSTIGVHKPWVVSAVVQSSKWATRNERSPNCGTGACQIVQDCRLVATRRRQRPRQPPPSKATSMTGVRITLLVPDMQWTQLCSGAPGCCSSLWFPARPQSIWCRELRQEPCAHQGRKGASEQSISCLAAYRAQARSFAQAQDFHSLQLVIAI
jgi:hypothetical protein